MKIKTVLTGMAAMCMTLPAFAESFPNDGYMLENKTYDNAATYENLGAYEGPVNATAEYDDTLYNIPAGQYLAHATETGTQCTAGNFCIGLTNVTYDAVNDQGITACSTLDSGAYPNSLAGATANTDCYHACTTADSNIAHAATFTGNAYYGGTNTCELATCETGYHIKPEIPNPTKNKIGGANANNNYAFVQNDGTASSKASTYGISDNNSFALDYGDKGILYGHGRCSTTSGYNNAGSYTSENTTSFDTLTDEAGQAGSRTCYCQIDGYKASSEGALQSMSSAWVRLSGYNDDKWCPQMCAEDCAKRLNIYSTDGGYRNVLLGTLGPLSPKMCVSDTITINWSDASQADIEANEAGSCTWGGAIRTPRAAATKPGKTFKGWRFSAAE